jgi:hypothetical protein
MELISKLKAERLKLKALLLVFFGSCFLCLGSAKAQSFSFSDLFGQGEKDIKNMEQQLTALIAFESSVRQGYNMLHSEWSAISNWKNGELGLHSTYYISLNNVNSQVKNDPDVTAIQTEQQAIINLLNAVQSLSGLQSFEQSYVQSVSQSLLKGCNDDLQQLQQVLKDGTFSMSDDERLQQIAKIQASMLDKYQFTQSFCNSIRLLVIQRNRENNEVQTLKQWYGNN